MSEVQNTTQYLPELQHIQPRSVETVKISPNNGTKHKQGNYIEFRINPNSSSVLDNSRCKLSATFNVEVFPNAGPTAFNTFSSPGLQSVFQRMTVHVGPHIVEDIQDYNRCYAVLSRVYTSIYQTGSSGSSTDLYNDTLFQATGNTAATGRLLNASAESPPAGGKVYTYNCCISLSLSSVFGPGSKFAWPLHVLKEPTFVRLYLTPSIHEVVYSSASAGGVSNFGAATNYYLTDVTLNVCQINYDQPELKQIKSMMPEDEVEYCVQQVVSSTSNIGYSSNERVILPNCSYSCVNNMIFNFWYSDYSAANLITMGNSPGCGLYRAMVYVDGVPLSAIKVGTSNSNEPFNSNSSLAASVLKLNRDLNMLFDSNTQLTALFGGQTAAKIVGNFNNINNSPLWATPATGSELPTRPSSTADGTAAAVGGCMVGFDLTQAIDEDSDIKGRDLQGKQVVFDCDQTNSIVNSTLRTVQCVMNISTKVYLDMKKGTIRVVR